MKTTENPQLQLAFDFVQYTGTNIFLTGKAGTGKTTFLHDLKKQSPKRMVVVAPTGVAAINAGGVTIHSFFQISFGPQVPGMDTGNVAFKRFSNEKKNILKTLDLLVIDEISMVRADLLDAIDAVLRRFRNRDLPFGGVQLLMIGDLQQLAPVVKEDEWQLLRPHYHTPFFFGSKALRQTKFVSIELLHVYRQSDERFIGLLNKIRENKLDQDVINSLNARFQPQFEADGEGYITLTTHNNKAQNINESRLKRLKGESLSFTAEISGTFPEYTYPTDEKLFLKKGAQVMFVKNDPSPAKLFYNGKIGKITGFDENKVIVQCDGDKHPIEVEMLEWQNVKYSLDSESKEIKEALEGSFKQIPLKLAWAITIHKSQGLTFEKAIIDAQAAFAHGQVYVALSRCKSLEGLVLSTRIGAASVKSDSGIKNFTDYVAANQPGKKQLDQYSEQYQQQLLYELFDFAQLQLALYNLNEQLTKNAFSLPVEMADTFRNAMREFRSNITGVAAKFKTQIGSLLKQEAVVERNNELQQRITKAAGYFAEKLDHLLIPHLKDAEIETDNKEVKAVIHAAMKKLLQEVQLKQNYLQACNNGFVLKDFLQKKAKAVLEKPRDKEKTTDFNYAEGRGDKSPYKMLKLWRAHKSEELGWEEYMIMPIKTMREIAEKIPSNHRELSAINGFGPKKLEYFGDELVGLLKRFRKKHGMEIKPPEKAAAHPVKQPGTTHEITYKMWKSGKSVKEIAIERKYAVSTIEGHLSRYIENGKIPIEKLVSEEKIKMISGQFLNGGKTTLTEVKNKLGSNVSFSELRWVLGHLRYKGIDPGESV